MIAEVIINTTAKELNKNYDYIIPDSILKEIKIGSRVLVPFGRKKLEEGFVVGIKQDSEFANKEIIKVEDNILNEKNIELANLMAKRYFCNISDCIKLMLPPGSNTKNIGNRIKEKTGNFVYLKKDAEEIEFDIEENKVKSEKQKRVLNFLFENEGIHILDLQAITETSRSIINTLEKNGYIRRDPTKPRALEIIEFSQTKREMINIPILGDINAGEPILATENIEDTFSLPIDFIKHNKDLFILKVNGNSMINIGVNNNDFAIIEKTQTAINGDIVVALIDDTATIKRFFKEKDHIRLQPENDNMDPIIIDDCKILGKLVGIFRSY